MIQPQPVEVAWVSPTGFYVAQPRSIPSLIVD